MINILATELIKLHALLSSVRRIVILTADGRHGGIQKRVLDRIEGAAMNNRELVIKKLPVGSDVDIAAC